MIGLSRQNLDDDLKMIRTEVLDFPIDGIDLLLSNIRSNKSLPFRHHVRDFLIGTQCMIWGSILITNNKKHFKWVYKDQLFTPQEFIHKMVANNK